MERKDLLKLIMERRSIRRFDGRPLDRGTLDLLVDAARFAPSGLNNQPWRFVTIEERKNLDDVAALTKYGKIISGAGAAIAVFIDNSSVYNRTKDVQSIGAAIENMLLAAHGLGLGACWLGEILNRREEVEIALGVPPELELMAVVALGWPKSAVRGGARDRFPLEKLIAARR